MRELITQILVTIVLCATLRAVAYFSSFEIAVLVGIAGLAADNILARK